MPRSLVAGSTRGPATPDIKDTQLRDRFDLGALRGPAITEIDWNTNLGAELLLATEGPLV
jgi:hypothetical protein